MSKSSKAPFGKFIQQKETGAKKKERIRQEKKVQRKETKAYFDKKKEDARAYRQGNAANAALAAPKTPKGGFPSAVGRKPKSADKQGTDDWQSGRDAMREGPKSTGGGGKKFVNKGYNRMSYMERKKKQAGKESGDMGQESGGGKKTGYTPQGEGYRTTRGPKKKTTGAGYKPTVSRDTREQREDTGSKPAYSKAPAAGRSTTGNKTFTKSDSHAGGAKRPAAPTGRPAYGKPSEGSSYAKGPVDKRSKISISKPGAETNKPAAAKAASNLIPLNKFISHAGITSRRDAADIVKSGLVVVNGKVITEPGFKVTAQDEVKYNGKQITIRKNMVYILINKPKDFITTTEDPQGRRTVLDIVKNATTERVYPIGRLDRNTTGVLLLTNDGELAQKLAHPSYMVKKIYEVKLDKPLVKKDFDAIIAGIELEDGFIAPDVLAYADTKDKSVIGIEIHSGRNRIVRRIFEHLGYDVRNLDRVMYANLTKKNVDRGKWRFLSEKEVRLLKYLNTSYTKK
jgi:23S rRNA pseudouridine2605 synthase